MLRFSRLPLILGCWSLIAAAIYWGLATAQPSQPTYPPSSSANTPHPAITPGRVIVGMDKGPPSNVAMQMFERVGATVLRSYPSLGVHVLAVPPGQEMAVIAALKANPNVRYAEPDYVRQLHADPVAISCCSDTGFRFQWNLQKVQALSAWDVYPNCLDCQGSNPNGPLVATVDTGIDLTNPDLAGRATGEGDITGHGTHVAGIIVAGANNGFGITGLAYNVRLASYRACHHIPAVCDVSDIINSIDAAVSLGAKVINLSLGNSNFSEAECEATSHAISSGVIVVAASGNEGLLMLDYPAACTDVIAVGASDINDNIRTCNGSICSNGTTTPFLVTAPGVNIYSTLPTNPIFENNSPSGWGPMSGTSMAAPHVTALVALMLGINPSLKLRDIKLLLAQNADKVGGIYGSVAGDICAPNGGCSWNNNFGYGRINAARTLCAATGNRPQVQKIFPNSGPLAGGTTVAVTGACFFNVQSVKFGRSFAPSSSIKVVSPSQLAVTSPPGDVGGLADVTVTTASGGTSATSAADLFAYGPVITSVNPVGGPMQGGTGVVIEGQGFNEVGPNDFNFGTHSATNVHCTGSAACSMASPPSSPGTVDVTVNVNGVTSLPSPKAKFTYSGPAIQRIDPSFGPNTGGTYIHLHGVAFADGMTVCFRKPDGECIVSDYVLCQTGTECVTRSPPGSGVEDIIVTVGGISSPPGPDDQFSYLPFPRVVNVSPATGFATGGTPVTIIGANFSTAAQATEIKFGTAAATSVVCNNTTACTAVTPPGAGTVDVTVTVGGATSLPADSRQFTYVPVVSDLTPRSGPENGGTNISITGAGFAQDVAGAPQTIVAFGANAAASVTCSSATSCVAVSPTGTGTVDLSVTVGGQVSASSPKDRFTYAAPSRRGWLHWYSGKSAALRQLTNLLVTYDGARKSVLLFGASPTDSIPPETWTWNDKSTWSQLSPATSPFVGTALAFSGNNNTAVLFGGLKPVGRIGRIVLIDSTSLWDGSNWTNVPPGVRPPARTGESMVFDAARGKVLLFGGCPNFGCADTPLFNDTWTWDGQTWTQEHPLNAPSPRGGASMAFNAADNTIVLFGGQDSINHPLDDTWIWNGSNWIQQQPTTSPGPRAHAGLAFHAALRGLLLFGGDLPQILLDAWTWDGATWKQVGTTGGPKATPVAMVYDEDAKLIFFLDTDRETWTWGGP
jgi:subtilisin family serine protease